MAEPHLSKLQSIIEQSSAQCNLMKAVSCKHFFGGAAAYIDDQIFMSLSPVGLALKLPEADCTKLFEKGGTDLRYFPKSPVKKGYVVLPSCLIEDSNVLIDWILRSMKYVKNN